jgi:hypothetical protein
MTSDEYIKTRVDDQISWYSSKSRRSKRAYRGLRVFSAFVALSIPVMSGFLDDGNAGSMKVALSIAGAMVALCEALLALYKFRDNWTNYRNAAEGLTQHKFLYATGAAPYGGADAFGLFVQNAESIMAGERIQWLKQNTMPEEAAGKGQVSEKEKAEKQAASAAGKRVGAESLPQEETV